MPVATAFTVLLGLRLLGLQPLGVQAKTSDVDLLVDGGTVVTMDAETRVLEGGAVAIRGDQIAAVLPRGVARPRARRTLDATDKLVIPGLVNTHGHVAMTLFRGLADDMQLEEWLDDYIFPAEAKNVSKEFVYWGTMLGCVEMALGGTTTFADMYYFEEEAARATIEVGLRGVLGQTVIGIEAPDYATPDEALVGAESFLRKYRDHPSIVPSVAPHALYTTPLDAVVRAHRLARRYGVPFQIHAAEARSEADVVEKLFGSSTIAVLHEAGILTEGTVLHHGVWLSDSDLALLAPSGAGVSHNPESNMKTAAGVARITDLLHARVLVGLGTDGAASNNNLDLFEEMDTAAKLQKLAHRDPTVLPALTVFRMATLGGASVLGLADRIGTLEAGKLADVVLIDLNAPGLLPLYDVYSQLVYTVPSRYVDTVMVGGRIVVEGGRIKTVDLDELRTKVRKLQQKVLAGRSLSPQAVEGLDLEPDPAPPLPP